MYNRGKAEDIRKIAKDLMPIIEERKKEKEDCFWKIILKNTGESK